MTADDAQPGDVMLDSKGKCWQRSDKFCTWSTFDGPVLHFGEWKPEYGPVGLLVLLVRDGKPVDAA